MISIIKRYAEAAAIISNWAREGAVIVRPQIAIRRAEICMACPQNIEKGVISSLVSKYIRMRIGLKHGVSLDIRGTKRLGRCSACYCESDLKVWLPLEKIKPADSERHKFDEDCWLFKMQ